MTEDDSPPSSRQSRQRMCAPRAVMRLSYTSRSGHGDSLEGDKAPASLWARKSSGRKRPAYCSS